MQDLRRQGSHWRSDQKAEPWCEEAVSQEKWEAYLVLGEMAERRTDDKTAFYFYQKAEKHDPGLASGHLGTCFLAGKGTQRDPAKAYFWLYLAVKKYKDDGLQAELDRAGQQISEQERKKQEKRAEKQFRSL